VRARPRPTAGRQCPGRRAGQLTHGHGPVVVGRPVSQVGPRDAGRERRQGQAVDPGRDRTVPAQVGAGGATAPAGGGARHPADAGQQGPHRCAEPRRRSRQPGRGVQQVHGEVGGELDRRLQLGVHRARGRRSGRGGRRSGRADRDDAADGPVRPVGEPVDAHGGRPPGEMGAVRPGTPGGDAPAELAPPRRPAGGRERARVDPEDADREPGGQPSGQVAGADGREVDRQPRTGAEQRRPCGDPGGGDVGPRGRCRLDRHVLPSRGSSCRDRGRGRGQGEN